MNAKIGKDENKFSLPNLSNRNDEYLNIKFHTRNGKLWTETYPNNVKAQLDYILINKK